MPTIVDSIQIDLISGTIDTPSSAQLTEDLDAFCGDECTACDNTGVLIFAQNEEPCSECWRGEEPIRVDPPFPLPRVLESCPLNRNTMKR